MKTLHSKAVLAAFIFGLLLSILNSPFATCFAQGTVFTYQGQLNDGGVPSNGTNYTMVFYLYDAPTDGTLLGDEGIVSVTVSNGLFTVPLDFGNQFDGNPRWLEISVEKTGPGGDSGFTFLSPRQQITSTPYSIQALNAATAATAGSANSVLAGNISGTIGLAQLPTTVITNGASGVNITGNFSGNGAGVTNIPFNSLADTSITNFPIVAWGDNSSGQTTVPAGLSNVTAVAAGDAHSLALKSDGTVVAWGYNYYGQTNVPAGLSNVTAVAAGGFYNLALKSDGTVVAWGYNYYGQATVPAGLSNVMAVAAGDAHSLALKSDGTVVAWGYNGFGQTTVPAGLSNVTAVAAGAYHSLALKSDGTVVAWGDDNFGQTTVPAGLSNVTAVAAGYVHSLALKSDGTVVAWGNNNDGQATVPAGLSNVTAVAAGGFYNLALKSDGTVVAWGDNSEGQTNVPAGLNNVIALAPGCEASHVLVIQRVVLANTFSGDVQINGVLSANGGGLTNLNASQITGTFTNGLTWGSGAMLQPEQGGSLELGNSLESGDIPFIDFHYGTGAAEDYNVRLMNDVPGQLSLIGNLRVTGFVTANGVLLTSDRNAKESFTPVSPQTVLNKVAALPITEWNYKTDATSQKHIGPMAQDFHAAFDLNGADDKHISVVDESGVALAAIQGLNEKVNEKDSEIKEQKMEIQTLQQSVVELRAMVLRLAQKQSGSK